MCKMTDSIRIKSNVATAAMVLVSTCLVAYGQPIESDKCFPENVERIFYKVPCAVRHHLPYSIENSSNQGFNYNLPVSNNMQTIRRYYLVKYPSSSNKPSEEYYDPLKGKTYTVRIDEQPAKQSPIRIHQYSTSLLKPIPEGYKVVGVDVPRIIKPSKFYSSTPEVSSKPLTGLKAKVDTVLTPICEC